MWPARLGLHLYWQCLKQNTLCTRIETDTTTIVLTTWLIAITANVGKQFRIKKYVIDQLWACSYQLNEHIYFAPGRAAKYCDKYVCLSLCLCSHNSKTTRPIFTKFFVHVTCSHGSVLLWRHCDVLSISAFVDELTFLWHGANEPESSVTYLIRMCQMGRSLLSMIALLSSWKQPCLYHLQQCQKFFFYTLVSLGFRWFGSYLVDIFP